MSFWTNVSYEMESQGISRKELAYMVNIKETTIHKAIERDSVPSADTALKIATALHVSLEYLLNVPKDNNLLKYKENEELQKAFRLYKKYSSIINTLDSLTKKEINAVSQLVKNLAK